jgi:membrane fusion protein, multidrug efflux system
MLPPAYSGHPLLPALASRRGHLIVALALGAALQLSGCSAQTDADAKNAKPPEGVPVMVAEASRETVPVRVEGIGNVEALASVSVKSRIDGQIVKVHFRDGAAVVQGQVLFEIDPRPALAQLRQAEANLAKDVALLQRAREQDARYQDLLQKKFVSPEAYAQIKSNLDSAQASVEADRAAVEIARLQVEYATIHAPIGGRAGRILIQQGNLVKANDTSALVVINQLSPIYVNFSVPEQYLEDIRRAMAAGPREVDVSATGADGKTFHAVGRLSFIDNLVDTATGTVKLRASVPNADAMLWPGQFVHASLTLGEQGNALVVPSEAVQTGPKGTYVFVIDSESKAQIRPVTVERAAGDATVIAKGLGGGEKVVVDGQSRLLPGVRVVIKPAQKAS